MKVISFIRECPDEVLAEFLAAYVSLCVHGALNAAGIVDISDQKIREGAEMITPKVRVFLHSDFEFLGGCLNDAGNGTGAPSPTEEEKG